MKWNLFYEIHFIFKGGGGTWKRARTRNRVGRRNGVGRRKGVGTRDKEWGRN